MLLKKKKKVLSLQKKTDELFTTTGVYAYIPTTLYGQLMPMKELHLWKNNPRKNDRGVKPLVEGIKVHGFRKPIVVDQNNIIRAGNTAFKAAKLLGMTMIPVAKSSFKSEVSATAYGISDNRLGENSTWDDDMLKDLMQADDLSYGFSQDELDLRLNNEMQIKEQELDILDTDNECPKCGYTW